MKETYGELSYKGKTYRYVFNLNVMEELQGEYGTLAKWGALTDGKKGEPNARAIIFGFRAMLNEGIDIANDENGTHDAPLTLKQVGRMITGVGLGEATRRVNDTVISSTATEQKNV